MKKTLYLVFVLFTFFIGAAIADEDLTIKEIADKKEAEQKLLQEIKESAESDAEDDFHRMTPRSSIVGLAIALRKKDYERAQHYLDLRNLPFSKDKKVDGIELSRKLGIIATRGINVSLENFSDDKNGLRDDGLPKYRDLIDVIDTPEGPLQLYLQRVPRGDGVYIWQVSNQTVAKIPYLYKLYGYNELAEKLAKTFPEGQIFGLEIWQIVMLIGIIVLAYFMGMILTYPIIKFLQLRDNFAESGIRRHLVRPLRFFITIIIIRHYFTVISPSKNIQAVFEGKTLLIVAIYFLFAGLISFGISLLTDKMKKNGQHNAAVLLRPASTAVKLLVLAFAIIFWMNNLGFEITTVLAGLGVGSLAIALAAQRSLENLIGSITIYAAQPVKVGDFCRFKETLGTVEEIGLRSTRLRTPSRTIVDIPNALFAAGEIENLTERDKILYRTRLRLSYGTKPQQLRHVMSDIREMIDLEEQIDEESSRVRFIELGRFAQELELYLYIKTSDYLVYLEHIEVVNLRLIDIFEQNEVKVAIPEVVA